MLAPVLRRCLLWVLVSLGEAPGLRVGRERSAPRFEALYASGAEVGDHPFFWLGTCNALREEPTVTCGSLSTFGARMHKRAASIVRCVDELKREAGGAKTSTFNFQGALGDQYSNGWRPEGARRVSRRLWVPDFVRKHFADSDVLRIRWGWRNRTAPWGAYDHTYDMLSPLARTGDECDETYYRVMVRSVFTLCPGGDEPFSNRFHEAIMAGSIPVIHSWEEDLRTDVAVGLGYRYFTAREAAEMDVAARSAELREIADANYRLFLRYQTFLHGDQVAPGYDSGRQPCLQVPTCAARCEQCKAPRP